MHMSSGKSTRGGNFHPGVGEGLGEPHPGLQTCHSAAMSLQIVGSEGGRRLSERSATVIRTFQTSRLNECC
jgi:hypothetical protein